MIKAIAIDDEPLALKVIENFCGKVDFISLEKTFTRPSEAARYLQKFPIDLLFLDIRMPSVSGLEFYKTLRLNYMVIFTTAYTEYAVEGFNISALDYLVKPFTYERFLQAANKARDYYQFMHQAGKQQPYLFIRADYALTKVLLSDILYIEGLDDYLKIHLTNRQPLVARMTMKSILEMLPSNEFLRVHRSFIVPVQGIGRVRNKTIYLGGVEI
ncbi:MAG TPA: LytTR family DNA-binding domain-containing protein, partial [Chitinophagales bacterium]|nr:LytTR family DNA-binding domain-containing protein [Chitinophagales bacterium]